MKFNVNRPVSEPRQWGSGTKTAYACRSGPQAVILSQEPTFWTQGVCRRPQKTAKGPSVSNASAYSQCTSIATAARDVGHCAAGRTPRRQRSLLPQWAIAHCSRGACAPRTAAAHTRGWHSRHRAARRPRRRPHLAVHRRSAGSLQQRCGCCTAFHSSATVLHRVAAALVPTRWTRVGTRRAVLQRVRVPLQLLHRCAVAATKRQWPMGSVGPLSVG